MQVNLTTLKNGLRVLTVERPQIESVSLGIWVNTGCAYETPDINGVSHFVEHMVFKGTQKRNALQISEDIENVGGDINAYTGREFTVFYAKMLKNDAELAIDVLADFIMSPTFDKEEMAKEREVIVQEIKRTSDDPESMVFEYFNEAAYANQAIGRSILGPEDKVRSFTPDTLREYMKHNYAAENMVVTAVGNINHEAFVKMVDDRMGSLRAKTSFVKEPQIYTGGEFIKKRDTEQAQVVLGFAGVDDNHRLRYPISIMANILGGGMSSRLFQEIREKRGLVYSVYTFTNSHLQTGNFGIYAGLNQEEIKNYLPVLADELKKIINEPVSDKELNRTKTQFKASLLMALESSSTTAEMVARHQLRKNKIISIEERVEQIEQVNKDDIMEAARFVFLSKPTYTILGKLEEYPSYEDVIKMIK